ncbi:aminoglycoside phosphotransferase family protein [Paenibacillus sp. SC116]|uniref:phosphotransferase enzyme family protein n=1 Tax=Paenibacillus sp. SC116 TaxID=2968986 RepID=UPI00215B1134|nr:aminoglycoside phosphotransferase family protein [Paenibacillus sp. SC116]MCR8842380.1 aminoglycoside phosphotransferase family protein [Paenibacillus sp. SC116]
MTNEILYDIVNCYDIDQPAITFLRHNENRTYRVDDALGKSYLLRIHQPVKESMVGLQHTYAGLLGELEMLDALASQSRLIVQSPLRNREDEFITVVEYEGQRLNCSVLTWLDGRDLQKEDVANRERVKQLGAQLAELHSFFLKYPHEGLENRPSQGIAYNLGMIETIKEGLKLELFTSSDLSIIEDTIVFINAHLEKVGHTSDTWGLIHGDLGLGNIIVTTEGKLSFIDFGFFGPGYYRTDVAMGAQLIPAEHRDTFLESYYGHTNLNFDELILLEGYMLISIIGFYAFMIGNESVHEWMRENMPQLCADHCLPYMKGERIFYKV